MFKGFSNRQGFHGVPNISFGFGKTKTVYGFPLCSLWLNAELGVNTNINNDPVNSWTEQVSGYPFYQRTAALQPRLNKNSVSFGGRDVIEFHVIPNLLTCDLTFGVGTSRTLVLVYEYTSLAATGSSSRRIIGDSIYTDARSAGTHFSVNASSNSFAANRTGYGAGGSISYGSSNLGIFNALPKIVVITRDSLVVNGASVPLTEVSGVLANFFMNSVGGLTSAFVGLFKIGEIIIYDRQSTLSECIEICNALNTKYALY
jgi:hypothetical protein